MKTAKNTAANAKVATAAKQENVKPVLTVAKGGKLDVGEKVKKEQTPPSPLQSTLKVVHKLHQKVVYRGNLIAGMDQFESFKFKQVEDSTGESGYDGCEITIRDDHRNSWTTKNTFIIEAVAKYVETLFREKLAEIEAEIKLPAA